MSVSWAVMSFEQKGLAVTLLDTPGDRDFREDGLPHAYRGQQCGDGARRR
jgi:peptide subunit release factor RF-3